MVKDCRIQGYNFVSHWFALGVLQAIADPATQSPRPAPGHASTPGSGSAQWGSQWL